MIFSNLYRACLLSPFAYWAYLAISGSLGADPAKRLNHKTGAIGLYFLVFNLALGIFSAFFPHWRSWPKIPLMHRRFLGVVNFVILIFHLLFYWMMEGFEFRAFTFVVTKKYLFFGAFAWSILFVLAVTSNNFAIRKLGGVRWKKIHRWVYLAMLLASFHVLSIEKTDLVKFGLICGSIIVLEIIRFCYFQFWKKQS